MKKLLSRPKRSFLAIVLVSMVLTVFFLNFLYFRFSIYEEPGGWGNVYDRGYPALGVYLICLLPYIPLIFFLAVPNKIFSPRIFLAAGFAFFFCSIFIDGATAWLPIEDDLDEVFLLSLIFRTLAILIAVFAFIFLTVTNYLKNKLDH